MANCLPQAGWNAWTMRKTPSPSLEPGAVDVVGKSPRRALREIDQVRVPGQNDLLRREAAAACYHGIHGSLSRRKESSRPRKRVDRGGGMRRRDGGRDTLPRASGRVASLLSPCSVGRWGGKAGSQGTVGRARSSPGVAPLVTRGAWKSAAIPPCRSSVATRVRLASRAHRSGRVLGPYGVFRTAEGPGRS